MPGRGDSPESQLTAFIDEFEPAMQRVIQLLIEAISAKQRPRRKPLPR